MHWDDRVYGPSRIDDTAVLPLIACATFQRLRGIRQAGPSAFAHPFKTVTRFEHSLGVYTLLRRLGASRLECIAGLLHDVSHTAFSHAVDFLDDADGEEQAHHESLKPLFLQRPDLAAALHALGVRPEQFYDDSIYTLLERPLPDLCADRIDYFLRDGRACGVVTPALIAATLDALVVVDGRICLNRLDVAREVQARYAEMNEHWWSGPVEAYIYNEFAEALREGLRLGALRRDDLLRDDEHVLACLRAARSPRINRTLTRITRPDAGEVAAYAPRVQPKLRWLDPPVVLEGSVQRLSSLEPALSPGR
jgi:HD superfamily phosphohydrolase